MRKGMDGMKRIFAVVLILMMSFSVFARAENSGGSDAFYETLGNFILFCDRLLEDELWVYGYVEAFYEERTYDRLNMARTAVQSAMREIRTMELPEYGISREDDISMMASDIDIDALIEEIDGAYTTWESAIIRLESLFDILVMDIYYEPALDNLMRGIELFRQSAYMDAQSLVNLMNYLLLQADSFGMSEDFWSYIKENTVVVSGQMNVYGNDEISLAEAEGELIDKIADNNMKISQNIELRDVYMLLIDEAVETWDFSILEANRTQIEGEYEVFPEAVWMMPENGEYLYIFTDPETDGVFIHTMGNEIDNAPDRIQMTFKGITGTQAVDYIRLLLSYGVETDYRIVEEDGKQSLQMLAQKGRNKLMMIWSEEKTIVYLTSPLGMTVPTIFYDFY